MDFDSFAQFWTDKLSPHLKARWIGTAVLFVIYMLHIVRNKSHCLIAYCLAVYLVHGFILFATPKDENIPDPFEEEYAETTTNDIGQDYHGNNLRPFIRNLPEFKFWLFSTQLIAGAFFLSFFSFTDIPVYTPILIFYFIFMVIATTVRLWQHSRKYNYNPFANYKSYFRD